MRRKRSWDASGASRDRIFFAVSGYDPVRIDNRSRAAGVVMKNAVTDAIEEGGPGDECRECPVASRREFLRDAAITIAGIAASLGFARSAAALPEHFTVKATRALERLGDQLSYPIPAADGAQIDRDAQVILVRWQNAVYAFNL